MQVHENRGIKRAGVAGLRVRAQIDSYKAFKLILIKIAKDTQ
jgi:hypothetical protein